MAARAYEAVDPRALKRAIYESDLYLFLVDAWPQIDPATFVPGRHMAVMCKYLEAFVEGEIAALLINIPPRHCKSLIVDVIVNAWIWARDPACATLHTSYAENLTHDHARLFKQLITSEWYVDLWPAVEIAYGHDKVSHYENTLQGKRYSVALNATMGKGGRYVVFDDPHNVLEAESDSVRDENVRKFDLILSTRVTEQPGKPGGFCVIMQRLHERDYSGVLITKREDLVHLCLPARFEPDHPFVSKPVTLPSGRELPGDWRTIAGDPLWPEMFDTPRLDKIAVLLGPYGDAGQLQQRPSPREGGMIKREWLKLVPLDVVRKMRRTRCRGWDLAGTASSTSPYTAGILMSFVQVGYAEGAAIFDVYIEHAVRERLEPAAVQSLVMNQARADGAHTHISVPQDPGQAGKGQAQSFARMLAAYPIHFSPESGRKETRFTSFATQAHAGNVYICEGAWSQAYVDEIVPFPGSVYKDQADATSRAYHRLLELGGAASSGVSSGSY